MSGEISANVCLVWAQSEGSFLRKFAVGCEFKHTSGPKLCRDYSLHNADSKASGKQMYKPYFVPWSTLFEIFHNKFVSRYDTDVN